jgi:hypothetical protein
MRLLEARGLEGLASYLRNRASVLTFYGHPGILRELADASELVRAGINAARHHHIGLLSADEVDAYVSEVDLQRVVRRMALEARDEGGNVRLRVVPERLELFDERFAPVAAVALDLVELADVRANRLGQSAIRDLDRARRSRRELEESAVRGQ